MNMPPRAAHPLAKGMAGKEPPEGGGASKREMRNPYKKRNRARTFFGITHQPAHRMRKRHPAETTTLCDARLKVDTRRYPKGKEQPASKVWHARGAHPQS